MGDEVDSLAPQRWSQMLHNSWIYYLVVTLTFTFMCSKRKDKTSNSVFNFVKCRNRKVYFMRLAAFLCQNSSVFFFFFFFFSYKTLFSTTTESTDVCGNFGFLGLSIFSRAFFPCLIRLGSKQKAFGKFCPNIKISKLPCN